MDIVEELRKVGELRGTPIRHMILAMVKQARDEIERLRASLDAAVEVQLKLAAEIERLSAALQRIVTEAESDNGLTAWDGADIAREALDKELRLELERLRAIVRQHARAG